MCCEALFLTGPYGRIAGVLGKRFIMFLNSLSLVLRAVYFTGVCTCFYRLIRSVADFFSGYFQFPIQWIYLTPLFDIIGGGSVILSSFTYGYVAESVESKQL